MCWMQRKSTRSLSNVNTISNGLLTPTLALLTEDIPSRHGPWMLSLLSPALLSVLKHCTNRSIREELYRVNVSKASTELFNSVSVAGEILALRNEVYYTELLGFQTFADLSLAQKTAPSVLEVEEMINAHHDTSDPVVETKFQQLQTFADPMATTDSWSNGTWLFWYALQHSSDGAAGIARRRTFFFDPYARPGQKRHGGWINETVNRSKVLGIPEHLVRVADFKIVSSASLMSFVADVASSHS
ncbi:hypothetical protein H310_11376 [Aphanomyces invadans]|uniref:Peptidase M3A/M3B catalytic domain-containing protein n=1 Tax=Aphanomyces invadans TaxID=157072 RepID=A0A024TM33_9STRA|nr:hypothetical protein H310_11376 [Aphanomyces invadans]ETV95093.1 hypothetical protein H310_11376 [Aphanomyces invadans]|eukprot:XP_008876266.1 hypothetical protein H310_11376 [Aphanomyces invadans]